MMKKLLVLALVLGIASLASAGIVIVPGLEYDVAGNTVTLTGAGVTGFVFQLMPNTGTGDDLSNDVIPAGFANKNNGVQYGAYGFLSISGSTGAGAPVTGMIYSFDFAPGVTSVQFIYSDLAGTSEVVINNETISLVGQTMIVPEPMTMGLLGLGSLFLARRKK